MRRALLLVAVLVLSALLTPPASADPPASFGRQALAPKVRPSLSILADVNDDERLDVITAVGRSEDGQESTRGISVITSREDGTFAPARRYTLPFLVSDLVVADVNGDGLDDIGAVALDSVTSLGRLYFLAGAPDGTFSGGQLLYQDRLTDGVFGRFRSANLFDAAVINRDGLFLVHNDGSGRLGDPAPVNLADAKSLAAVDFDADGIDELVVAAGDGSLTVVDGVQPGASTTGDRVVAMDGVDVSGDAGDELLVTFADGSVKVFDRQLHVVREVAPTARATSATAGDLDGDGAAEILTVSSRPEIHVFGTAFTAIPLAHAASDVLVADVTGGPAPEVLAVEPATSIIEIVSDPLGEQPKPTTVRTFLGGWDTELVDLNGDGADDMLAANCWSYIGDTGQNFRVEVFLNNGDGTMRRNATLTAATASPCSVATGDVDGDGDADVLMADYYSGAVQQWLGNGDGTFTPAPTVVPGCYFAHEVTTGDFNGDGTDDAALLCRTPSVLSILVGTPAGLVRSPVSVAYGFGAEAYELHTGDVDGDGNTDVVVGSFNSTCATVFCVTEPYVPGRPITYFLGGGNLTFELPRSYLPASPYFTVDVADVDGDPAEEIITPRVFDDVLEHRDIKADGSAGEPVESPTYDYPWSLSAGDVTGDGETDLVMSHGPQLVTVTPGNGDGTFGGITGYVSHQPTGNIYTGQLDGDDRPDLLVVQAGQAQVFLQR